MAMTYKSKARSRCGIETAFMMAATLAGIVALPASAFATATKVWTYSFTNGADGANPIAGVTLNNSGTTLYGASFFGGANGQGTLFSIPTSGGTLSVLHAFNSTGDGAGPGGTPIFDKSNTILLGTTAFASINSSNIGSGNGTVYAYSTSSASYSVVHTFSGGSSDGANSYAGLLSLVNARCVNNDFYFGTTTAGGTSNYGTLFKIAPTSAGVYPPSSYSSLYSVSNLNGINAYGPLACDPYSKLYGTTVLGGSPFKGVSFSITTSGASATAINQFGSSTSYGGQPRSGLFVVDPSLVSATTLLGTTTAGGTHSSGVVYMLTYAGGGTYNYTTIYNFGATSTDGNAPWATLISLDGGTTLYGTTTLGGTSGNGTVFKLAKGTGSTWTYTKIYDFAGGSDGANPYAALAMDNSGNLYGTTKYGGANGYGTIFEITP